MVVGCPLVTFTLGLVYKPVAGSAGCKNPPADAEQVQGYGGGCGAALPAATGMGGGRSSCPSVRSGQNLLFPALGQLLLGFRFFGFSGRPLSPRAFLLLLALALLSLGCASPDYFFTTCHPSIKQFAPGCIILRLQYLEQIWYEHQQWMRE